MSFLKDLLKTVQGAKDELDNESDTDKLLTYVGIAFFGLIGLLIVFGVVVLLLELAWKALPFLLIGGAVYAVAVGKGWVKKPSFPSRKN